MRKSIWNPDDIDTERRGVWGEAKNPLEGSRKTSESWQGPSLVQSYKRQWVLGSSRELLLKNLIFWTPLEQLTCYFIEKSKQKQPQTQFELLSSSSSNPDHLGGWAIPGSLWDSNESARGKLSAEVLPSFPNTPKTTSHNHWVEFLQVTNRKRQEK